MNFIKKQIGQIMLMSLAFASCQSSQEQSIQNETPSTYTFDTLTEALANTIAPMPMHCIFQEYPNKTGHTASSNEDILKTPAELHPSFYGCFDWHSSVHGHWMLVRILNHFPNLQQKDSIIYLLEQSLTAANLAVETAYFENNILGKSFERTYGWAWLLKLDQELGNSTLPAMQQLHQNLQPLTQKIIALWKDYLPKQSYPNKTGVHGNTAFALRLALDWAVANKDVAFEQAIKEKAKYFYQDFQAVPAQFEPDGSDFFSPSLYVADLMTQVLDKSSYNVWIQKYFTQAGIERLCEKPTVSDRNDYQIVHLDGLMFSRVVNMRAIIPYIEDVTTKQQFYKAQEQLLKTGLEHLSLSNYGGEHWLGSFAILALSGY